MESNTKTALPYAIAAFEQAQEEGDTGRWSEMLALIGMVCADPAMKGLMSNPSIKSPQLAGLIIDVCGDHLSQTGGNFVRVLAANGRLGTVGEVVAAYEARRAAAEKRSDAVVVSAYALSPAEENAITVALTKRLGTKVELTVELDPELIGGMVVRCGDTVLDASIRGQLDQLSQTLA